MLFEKIQLEPDEQVLKVVRKHWFIILTELLATLLVILTPFFFLGFFILFPEIITMSDNFLVENAKHITFGTLLWIMGCILAGFATWTHYYLDLWVITDRRIILVDQVGFFNRNVSIFRLERLQDIEFYIKGLLPTLLNFGTIKAQTASAFESNFQTAGLPDPRHLQSLIQKASDNRMAALRDRQTEIS
jgi:hypothetical protein